MATETTGPTLTEIEAARRGLADVARVTPVYASDTFSRLAAREVVLKAENLQRTGSFKVRGAVTRIASLPQRSTMSAMRTPNRPLIQTTAVSPGWMRLAIYASIPAPPVPGSDIVVAFSVWYRYLNSWAVSSITWR